MTEQNPPSLESLGAPFADPGRQAVASALRESPALRALTDVMRADGDLFAEVAAFTGRRVESGRVGDVITHKSEFAAEYDVPGRSVAPMFAGLKFANPDLLDTALGEHFEVGSKEVAAKLEEDSKTTGFSYVPTLVIGTGPQGQIYVSEAVRSQPGQTETTIIIDKAKSVGGTFQDSTGINININNRTRPQTDAAPIPGTPGNLSVLVPGVMTPGDLETQSYIPADGLGRTIRINHALNNVPIGLGLELVSWVPDDPAAKPSPNFPGAVSAVVYSAANKTCFTIRADKIVALTGGGETDISRFDEPTQKLIQKQAERFKDGDRKTRIFLYDDLYTRIQDTPFPLKGFNNVGVAGARDGGATAVGTLLGYEPRIDKSVIQLDSVKALTWFGQTAATDLEYLQQNRIGRYGALSVEFPRDANPDRAHRITPSEEQVTNIYLDDDGKPVINDEVFDAVIIPTGYTGSGDEWLLSRYEQPIKVGSKEANDLITKMGLPKVGTVFDFPEDCNIRRIQVLSNDFLKDMATIALTSSDGSTNVYTIKVYSENENDEKTLEYYLDLNNLSIPVVDQEPSAIASQEQNPRPKDESLTIGEYLDLDFEGRTAFLRKGPIIFGLYGNPKFGQEGYKVRMVSTSTLSFGRLDYDPADNSIAPDAFRTIAEDRAVFDDLLAQQLLSAKLIVNDELANGFKIDERGELFRSKYVKENLDAFVDLGAIFSFEKTSFDDGVVAKLVVGYRDPSGRFQYYVVRSNNAWATYSTSAIADELDVPQNVRAFFPSRKTPEVLSAKAQPGISGAVFKNLTNEARLDYLVPGSIFFTGRSQEGIYEVVSVDDAGKEVIVRQQVRDLISGFLVPANKTEETINIAQFARRVSTGAGIGLSPILRKEIVSKKCTTIDAPEVWTDEIIRDFANRGAVFIGRPNPTSNYDKLVFVKNDTGEYTALVFGTSVGELATDFSDWKYILNNESKIIDIKFIALPSGSKPPTQSAAPAPASPKKPPTYRKALKPSISMIEDSEGNLLAKKVNDVPFYLAGPSAQLPVPPASVELIPDIPDNTAAMFASQPAVQALARLLTVPQPASKNVRAVRVPFPEADRRISNKRFDATLFGAEDTPLPALRMTTDGLLRYGLSLASRQSGFVTTGGSVRALNLQVFKNLDQILVAAVTRASDIVPDSAALDAVFGNRLILIALNKILSKRNTSSLNLKLPYDGRGLQVDRIEATTAKYTARKRSKLPTLISPPSAE